MTSTYVCLTVVPSGARSLGDSGLYVYIIGIIYLMHMHAHTKIETRKTTL